MKLKYFKLTDWNYYFKYDRKCINTSIGVRCLLHVNKVYVSFVDFIKSVAKVNGKGVYENKQQSIYEVIANSLWV